MKQVMILLVVLAFARAAAGQTADDYRGGWRTDSGEAHTYEFSIRGATVRGIYCTYCADATTLAFVDGTFGPDGIRFEVTHVNADGSTAYKDKAVATFSQGRLTVTGTSGAPGGGTLRARADQGSAWTGSDPGDGVRAPEGSAGAGQHPAPEPRRRRRPALHSARSVEVDADREGCRRRVAGIRRRGAEAVLHHQEGRRHGCAAWCAARCDNPYTMAALDDFRIEGDTLTFNILHEDWGDGELPTFDKHVTARVGWNEMRCTTAADHQPPPPPARSRGLRPGLLAAGAGADRGDRRQRVARVAAEEHVVAALAGARRPLPGFCWRLASARRAPFRIDGSW